MFTKHILNFFKSLNNKWNDLNVKANEDSNDAFRQWKKDERILLENTKKIYIKNGRDTKEIDILLERIKKQIGTS
jgi:hypothetical protein